MRENGNAPDVRKKKNKTVSFIAFIVCVVIALVLWIYVMNAENSDYTKTFTVDLLVTGEEELLAERNLELFSEPSTVTVEITVQGTKVNVMKYSEHDFNASVDLSTVKESGFSVLNISVVSPSSSVTVVKTEPATATVFTDVHEKKTLVPTAVCLDDDPVTPKYPTSALTVDTNGAEFYLDGPRSEIERVARCEAVVTVSMLDKGTGGLAATKELVFYDENGDPVKLTYSVVSQQAVTVKVAPVG